MPCPLVADDVGSSLPKAGADFLGRRGNDVLETLIEGLSIAQANSDLAILMGPERGGEIGRALQVGPPNELEYCGTVDSRVVLLFQRTARQHGRDAEGNAHLGL